MSDYTPTTDEVRMAYGDARCVNPDDQAHAGGCPQDAEFDRWLAAHDAEKRVEWEAEHVPGKDERLARYMAMVTPLGYQSALTVVQEMTKLLAAEGIARSLAEQGETEWATTTLRGFGLTSFEYRDYASDDEPREFTVQESSLASQRKVWIGVEPERSHLSEAEATIVRDALNAFLASPVPDTINTESEGKA